jgi:hypothetical protein
MKARIALFALAAVVTFGGLTGAAVAIGPSCPDGSYRNASGSTRPSETGPIPNPTPCTSYATHIAPSSGLVIPRYATGLDPHWVERWAIGIASLLLGAGLAGRALALGRRRRGDTAMSGAAQYS